MEQPKLSELHRPFIVAVATDRTVAGMSVLVPDRKKNVDALVNFLGE